VVNPEDIELPAAFGPYELRRLIGAGGMARVYEARLSGPHGFEKRIAIKMMLPAYVDDEEFVTMLIDEAKIAAALNHSNICQIHDLGRIGDSYYIAMEYVEGADLNRVVNRSLQKRVPIPYDVIAHIGHEICAGLYYAHAKTNDKGEPLNIIHRDISPANILISMSGEVKIVDFGVAKAAHRTQHTMVGVVKGKYQYMSPEQITGKKIDHRSDIFAAGIVLYESIAGQMMYPDGLDMLDRIRSAKIRPLEKLRRNVPPELNAIIKRALSRTPEDRYQTGAEMGDALGEFLVVYRAKNGSHRLDDLMAKLFKEERGAEPATASPDGAREKARKKTVEADEERPASAAKHVEIMPESALPNLAGPATDEPTVAQVSEIDPRRWTQPVPKGKERPTTPATPQSVADAGASTGEPRPVGDRDAAPADQRSMQPSSGRAIEQGEAEPDSAEESLDDEDDDGRETYDAEESTVAFDGHAMADIRFSSTLSSLHTGEDTLKFEPVEEEDFSIDVDLSQMDSSGGKVRDASFLLKDGSGNTTGPFSRSQLRGLFTTGALTPDDLALPAGEIGVADPAQQGVWLPAAFYAADMDAAFEERSVRGLGEPLRTFNLQIDPAARVFVEAALDGRQGLLVFDRPGVHKQVLVTEGRPLYASSNIPEEQLGRRLHEERRVSTERLDDGVRYALQHRQVLSEALVTVGALTTDALARQLVGLIEGRVLEIFGWRTGFASFYLAKLDSVAPLQINVGLAPLVLEGVNRAVGHGGPVGWLRAHDTRTLILTGEPSKGLELLGISAPVLRFLTRFSTPLSVREVIETVVAEHLDDEQVATGIVLALNVGYLAVVAE
jgi:serine/threonine protein kinase